MVQAAAAGRSKPVALAGGAGTSTTEEAKAMTGGVAPRMKVLGGLRVRGGGCVVDKAFAAYDAELA